MNSQKSYYAIRFKPDEFGERWFYSWVFGGCLQLTSGPLPHQVYIKEKDASRMLDTLKRDLPKQSDGAKIVMIGINYSI